MKATYAIFKTGVSSPIFIGSQLVVERALEALRSSFYFVAGTAKPRTDKFPYSISEI
jgi:hypothetical protein